MIPFTPIARNLRRVEQQINKVEAQKYRMMHKLALTPRTAKRAKIRSLITIGALVDKAGLLETFGITLGEDLQKSPEMQEKVASLFEGLLALNEGARLENSQ